MAITLLIAVRTNHSLSHDGDSFFGCRAMQASSKQTIKRANDFITKIFFRQTAADVDIIQPSSPWEKK
jgi:hypothetical protein